MMSSPSKLFAKPVPAIVVTVSPSFSLFDGKEYQIIHPLLNLLHADTVCSVGQNKREIPLLDMLSKQLRENYGEVFINEIISELTPRIHADEDEKSVEAILEESKAATKSRIVGKKVSDLLDKVIEFSSQYLEAPKEEAEIKNIVARYNQSHKLPEDNNLIPFEIILEHKKGYCRHRSLFIVYLLVVLTKELGEKDSYIYYFRDELFYKKPDADGKESIRHAVAIYQTKNHLFLLDGGMHFYVDINQLEKDSYKKEKLEKKYHLYNIMEYIKKIKEVYLQTKLQASAEVKEILRRKVSI